MTLLGLVAFALYFGAHFFRCMRLYVLSLGQRKGGARLVAIHCVTVWPSAVVPFKMGEVLRIGGFCGAMKSPSGGVSIWLIERFSDAVAIIILLGSASALLVPGRDTIWTLSLAGAFIVSCGVTAWMLVEVLPFLRKDLILRSRSKKGLIALRLVDYVDNAAGQVRTLLVGRFSLTLLIGLVIWCLELGAIAVWSFSVRGEFQLTTDFLLGDPSAMAAFRIPVFALFTLIGIVLVGGIVFKKWQAQHA